MLCFNTPTIYEWANGRKWGLPSANQLCSNKDGSAEGEDLTKLLKARDPKQPKACHLTKNFPYEIF